MTEDQLVLKIQDEIKEAGSLRALGNRWKVSAQYLCDLVHRRRRAGKSILDALGLVRETRIISSLKRKSCGKAGV